MQRNTISGSSEEARGFHADEQSLDELIAKAVEAAAAGENIEQVMDVMLTALPASVRDKARSQFTAKLAKRGLRQPAGEPDIPSRATLSRIRAALAVSTRHMIERILQLARLRPDLARRIQEAGKALAQSGVMADKMPVSEGDLGAIVPSAGAGKAQPDRGAGGRGT